MSDYNANKNARDSSTVLITGGSGLIGRSISSSLLDKGYNVIHLSRNPNNSGKIKAYSWDPGRKIIDPQLPLKIDYLVHLAGANIGEKRWTSARKKEISESRIDSTILLHKTIIERGIQLKGYISASATGIYGAETTDKIFSEKDAPAPDFLASVCKEWETTADLFAGSGIRTVKIRTAVVLEKTDSALSKLMIPAKFGFLVQMGNGKQYMPWIHIKDLTNIYLKAIQDIEMAGAYNAVAPFHVSHMDFMTTLGSVMKKPVLPVPIPGFVLRTVLGEMSQLILSGSRVSSDKLIKNGYSFQFNNLKDALNNVING